MDQTDGNARVRFCFYWNKVCVKKPSLGSQEQLMKPWNSMGMFQNQTVGFFNSTCFIDLTGHLYSERWSRSIHWQYTERARSYGKIPLDNSREKRTHRLGQVRRRDRKEWRTNRWLADDLGPTTDRGRTEPCPSRLRATPCWEMM